MSKSHKNNFKCSVAILLLSAAYMLPAQAEDACVYPGTDQSAPGWICNQPLEGAENMVTAVASAQVYGDADSDRDFAKSRAAAEARLALVNRACPPFTLSNGVVTLRSQNAQTNARTLRVKVSPNGLMYVLVGDERKNIHCN